MATDKTPANTYTELGYWLLWLFAGAALGIGTDKGGGFVITTIIGAVTGGIVAGFMPWLARKWNTSRLGWWAWNGFLIALIVISLYVKFPFSELRFDPSFPNFHLSIAVESILVALIVAAVSRWLCQRWIRHMAYWWMWVTGVIVVSILVSLYLVAAIFTTYYIIGGP